MTDDTEEVTIHGIHDGQLIVEHADGHLSGLSTIREGEALHGDIVELQRLDDSNKCQLRTLYRHGPAKVTSAEYHEGWDQTFGGKPKEWVN